MPGIDSIPSSTTLTAIDNAVLRIGQTYTARGQLDKVTSYSAAPGGSIVNEVQRVYNAIDQLTAEYQSHADAVNTSSTPVVSYSYASGSAGTVRLETMTYPNNRELRYDYGGTNSAADLLGRIESLKPSPTASSSTTHATYTYLGASTIVKAEYPEPEIRWDLTVADTPIQSHTYTGLDRFFNSGDGFDSASARCARLRYVEPIAADGQTTFTEQTLH